MKPSDSHNQSADQQGVRLAIDAMGGDHGLACVVEGAAIALRNGMDCIPVFVGKEGDLSEAVKAHPELAKAEIIHAENVVEMTDKPATVLRRGRESSMWRAVEAVQSGQAQAVISGGNTGALMAVAYKQLGMIPGVDRPAISAMWPTPRGRSVVLDVGANVEATEAQLVQFAVMGEAYFRAMTNTAKPSVGLLNVGAEELKGHELIRSAARTIREAVPEIDFRGFVEGDDISKGAVDVVVTDGFSGNIALKSAEGAARLLGGWLKESLTENLLSKLGALFLYGSLRRLKTKMDPSSSNGGLFLGLNGIVVKSHGGADAMGIASALQLAADLARHPFQNEVAATVARINQKSTSNTAGDTLTAAKNNTNQAVGDNSGNIKAVV